MAPKLVDADRLARRLAGYGLGIGAVAAGMALPQKADADIIYDTFGTFVASAGDVLYLRFTGGIAFTAGTSDCWGPGFNFLYQTHTAGNGFSFRGGSVYTNYSYAIAALMTASIPPACFAAHTWSAPDTSIDLSTIACSGAGFFWSSTTTVDTFLTLGSPAIVGLRMSDGASTYYGWAELERRSLDLNDGAFNNTGGGSITVGQIPEPSSLLLLLSGAAGLSTLRKRRGQEEETTDLH